MRSHNFFITPCAILIILHLTACLADSSQICGRHSFECSGMNMSYPFGKLGDGCGLLGFQVECDGNNTGPKFHFQRNNYRILNTSLLHERKITIVNDKFFQPCGLDPDTYDDLQDSPLRISQQNGNVTLLENNCGNPTQKHFVALDCNKTRNSRWAAGFYDARPDFCTQVYPVPVFGKNVSVLRNGSEFLQFLQKGFLVEWSDPKNTSPDCGSCESTRGLCGYIPFSEKFCCYCPDGKTHPSNCSDGYGTDAGSSGRGKKSISAATVGGIIGVVGLIAVTGMVLLFYMRRNPRNPTRNLRTEGYCKDRTHDLETGHKIGILPIFSYNELEEATNFFGDENELGNGGFGSVYLGYLRDGRSVAVKRLYQDNSRRVEQFLNEVEILSSLQHTNLVRLFGCTCPNSRDLLLVYEYVPNGTLADHLHGRRKRPGGLPWGTRLNIAIQTARALAFLHGVDPPIFHRDVKSANILLDENLTAKVSDFGLSRLAPLNVTHVTTAPHGTPGYLDPEYHQSFQLTDKSDVYSFGVVLVEIISAKLAVDVNRNRREISLANMAIAKIQTGALHELVDPDLGIERNFGAKAMVSTVAELAYECLAIEGDDRPNMKEVVHRLEQIKESGNAND